MIHSNLNVNVLWIVCLRVLIFFFFLNLQSYNRGSVEPPSDYHADNSRSDLSDILEEEEEDYSDHLGEAQPRGYTVGANRVKKFVHYKFYLHFITASF